MVKNTKLSSILKQVLKESKMVLKEGMEYEKNPQSGYVSNWVGKTPDFKTFIDNLKNLPKDLKYITVPKNYSSFNPSQETIEGPITPKDIQNIEQILINTLKDFEEKGEEVTSFSIRSFFGVQENPMLPEAAYIQLRSKSSDELGKKLNRGDFGSLD
jgi:hypothetical protein